MQPSDYAMIDLQTPRFVVDHVPAEARTWVEKALTGPLNRFLQPLTDAIKRVMLAQVNVQVLEYRGYPPTVALPADFPSTLSGPCLGVLPLTCRELEGNGALGASVSALTSPAWSEVVKAGQGSGTLRLTSQETLNATARYFIRWLAVGK